jgi:hypothetical protein
MANCSTTADHRTSVEAVHGNGVPSISITLSPAQVDDVLRAAAQSRALSVSVLLGTAGVAAAPSSMLLGDISDPRLSRSLLRGLSLLACFDAEGAARGIIELANELDLSPSTAHRYALTLVHLGLLERSPDTRKYGWPTAKKGRPLIHEMID